MNIYYIELQLNHLCKMEKPEINTEFLRNVIDGCGVEWFDTNRFQQGTKHQPGLKQIIEELNNAVTFRLINQEQEM